MMNKNDLKIEFRAVPYADMYYALEYRISPDQDLEYIKKISLLCGLIKFDWKTKYSTKWEEINVFKNFNTSYLYDIQDDLNWTPILIKDKDDLGYYKSKYKTLGQWMSYIQKRHDEEIEKYKVEREKYLKRKQILY